MGGPTSKDAAGFVSREAIRYEAPTGRREEVALQFPELEADPRLHVVEAGERLRVFVFPELDPQRAWSATHVAVDVEFSDGSRLSELDTTDQYGVPLTARAQGQAKILYADQWNDVQVDLAPAVGRTITSVLWTSDAPSTRTDGTPGPEVLTGWIDGPFFGPMPQDPPIDDPVAWVDTRRGTHASGDFSRGNNLPLTAWPNGFAFLTPATDARTARWVYEYHRSNDEENRPRLQGVAICHQPSPWMGDRNQLVLMPQSTAEPQGDPVARSLPFSHDAETARPDVYRNTLQDGTTTGLDLQVVPTDHGLALEARFDEQAFGRHLLLEGVDENTRIDLAGAVFDGAFSGWVDNGSEGNEEREAGRSRMYVAGSFDPAPRTVGPAPGGLTSARVATFDPSVTTVTVRLATSFIGSEQARRNLTHELSERRVKDLRADAHAAWAQRLSVIDVDGATPSRRRALYGNLYRLNLYPNSQHENTGTRHAPVYEHASPVLPLRGAATDTRTNAQVLPGKFYVNHGFWDTYRTAWPAYTLLYPDLAAELVDGFVQHFRDGGWIPRWSSPGYADCMTGTSSDIAFADAAIKGVDLPDPLGTYEAGLRNATVAPTDPLVGRKGVERGFFTGYVDTDTGESVSWALEAHINDFGLAAQAELLSRDLSLPEARRAELAEEATYLRSRSLNYVKLFDPAVNFFQGRRPDGTFAQSPEEFDPCAWGGDFTETDGWNFAFHVPHDGEGLAGLYGGREGLRAKLDEFFATEETGQNLGGYGHVIHEMIEARAVRMGQFGVSNQPAHHIPFLYHHAGAPHRAQEVVREVHERLFTGEQIGQGYPGDEDNGEMSAWWLLTALGIYPLQLGTDTYHVVAPLFDSARVHPLGGADFTVVADGQGPGPRYVQALTRDGESGPATYLRHGELRGELRFTLGTEPGPADEPAPSLTAPGQQPAPLVDLLPAGSGPLVDDDSRTEQQWPATGDDELVIELPALTEPGEVEIYTLTSGAGEGADPVSWRLEARTSADDEQAGSDADGVPAAADGEVDGATSEEDGAASAEDDWIVLDERTDQAFRWRRQTRPFVVQARAAQAGQSADLRFDRYRLVVTATSGGPTTGDAALALAQVELLGRA